MNFPKKTRIFLFLNFLQPEPELFNSMKRLFAFVAAALYAGVCIAAVPPSSALSSRSFFDSTAVSVVDTTHPWKLVWSDEFNYTGLPDPARWSYEEGGHGWGNGELEYYTKAQKANASVSGGFLHITARKEKRDNNPFTSARLRTRYKGDWLYGRVEVKAKLPSGRGLWPAIWMLPSDWVYGDWPGSGEIDIMENVGFNPDTVWGSVHTKRFNHVIGTQFTRGFRLTDAATAFHVYAVEWTPDHISFFVDSKLYGTFRNTTKGWEEWPFDKRFHLLLNVAVGGGWGGAKGVDSTVFPESMDVDYVRVYQKEGAGLSDGSAASVREARISARVDSLLSMMTLEEKVGQLNQYTNDLAATGPVTNSPGKLQEVRDGKVGSMLNVKGARNTHDLQEEAMKSRLKIPLLFGQDVIHGYRVTFPIPLGEAASWDMDAIRLSARIAATEAAASGIHWTFAPMVDIALDPRWGRVMEGAGEDPYLGSQIAKARVLGFQGDTLGSTDAVMACAKHFAAYGAAIGGRDYNSVDMSLRNLWEFYLPPFKAALDAGAATFMNSFNDLNGVPATGNEYLQRTVLKGKWNFKGFVVSDWGSMGEMIPHGYVKDGREAAAVAIKAGSDMDMESRVYTGNLADLVRSGEVSDILVEEAVRRVLTKKFELALFDDPFRFSNEQREQQVLNSSSFHQAERVMGEKSIVLLKNQGSLLPLNKDIKKLALIGPLMKSEKDMMGFWSVEWAQDHLVSPYEGIAAKVGKSTQLLYAKGAGIDDTSRSGFAEAVAVASKADVAVMAIGERYDMSGEAKSRANIHIPGVQEELVKAVVATGKPVVVMVMGGRPLIFNWTADHVPSILFTWWLGSEAGNAMADVLFGDYNPSGHLPISFPREEGQIPVYYNYLNTGRPAKDDNDKIYRSGYIDMAKSPRFAFGHGLSYTTFGYSDLKLSKTSMKASDSITVSFVLANTGKYDGEEVVQLYLRDLVAQPLRPVKELKDFRKVFLKAGESKTISFVITREKLAFYNEALEWITQPGEFTLMIGSASDDIRLQQGFTLQ